MIPARRVYILLLIGIAVAPLLATIWSVSLSILAMLLFDGAILALAIADSVMVRRHRVQVQRSLPPRLSIGRENPVILAVSSTKAARIQICDDCPTQFNVSTAVLSAFLPANSRTELTYTARPHQRGEFSWGDIQVRQLGAWGLAWDNWKISQSQQVKVYPDLMGLRSLSIRLTLQSAGSIRKLRQRGIGTEFAELKDYSTGDDLRLIDWKATARRSRPLVKVLEPEHEQTLIILLDRGRLMTAQVSGLKRFDWGLNATLALMLAAVSRGDRVGVGVFDKQMHLWIPPQRGRDCFNRAIDRLTPIQPVLLESDYMEAVTSIVQQQARRALVVLITDLVDSAASAEFLTALGRLTPRYLPFGVTLRDRQVDRLVHTATNTVPTTYTRAVALDLLSQRQVAFAQLKQKGVLVLDAPADSISEQLVDRYLQLKSRNLL